MLPMNSFRSWLVVLLCIALWSAPVFAQSGSWERLLSGGPAPPQRDRYAEAEKDFLAAVGIAEKFGADVPRLAKNLYRLASLYLDLGRYPDAERLSARALAIREKILGPEHPDVAQSLDQLAALY